jgi:DNA-binding NarL/FixJ family response regulator
MNAKTSPSPARLVIADGHAMVREGIRTMLAKELDLEELFGKTKPKEDDYGISRQKHL